MKLDGRGQCEESCLYARDKLEVKCLISTGVGEKGDRKKGRGGGFRSSQLLRLTQKCHSAKMGSSD